MTTVAELLRGRKLPVEVLRNTGIDMLGRLARSVQEEPVMALVRALGVGIALGFGGRARLALLAWPVEILLEQWQHRQEEFTGRGTTIPS